MKALTGKLVIPITIISFFFITKWWYALPEDAPDTMYTGFPLVYAGAAWHTSLAYQIFIMEFLFDLLIYFLLWFLITYCTNRFLFTIKIAPPATIFLWVISLLIIIYPTWFVSMGDNIFEIKRTYGMEIMETGYEFFWQHAERPDFHKYHP